MKNSKNIKVDSRMTTANTKVTTITNEETGESKLVTLHRDHAKPSTRREFLATGMLATGGTIVLPSILNVLARPDFAFGADAAQCSVQGAAMPAFITVNLSGGGSLSGNLPPLGQDRQPLPKYDLLGLGPDQGVFTDATKGSMMFQGVRVAGTQNAGVPAGFFWLGLKLRAPQSAIDKTSLISVAVASNDDTSANMLDASGMIMAAGATGDLLPALGTNSNTGTGIGQAPSVVKPSAPLIVRSYADIEGALKPAGTLANRLTDSRRQKLLQLVNSLSGPQARTVASTGSATGVALAKIIQCATGKNIEISSTLDAGIDPAVDSTIAGIWGIALNNKTGANYAQAAMVYNGLKLNSAATGIDMGGYDYHGQGRGNQNATDQRAGEQVGRILATAEAMGKAVMIYCCSDGSVSSNGGSGFGGDYSNDSGSRGMNYIFAYNPVARPKMKDDRFKHQVGFFSPGQGASDQSPVATPTKGAVAVAANYLAFAGQLSKLDAVAPGVFQRSELDEVVRIA